MTSKKYFIKQSKPLIFNFHHILYWLLGN